MATPSMEKLAQALPQQFGFYHLGDVELIETRADNPSRQSSRELPTQTAVAFTYQGDARGVLALIFDSDLDISIYSEMGNVIASRMITHLHQKEGADILLSPPKVLNAGQLAVLMKSEQSHKRTYLHRQKDQVIQVEVLIASVAMMSEEVAHA